MTKSRSQIAVTARALQALADGMPPPVPTRFTGETFDTVVANSMEIDRESGITALMIERAPDDLIVEAEWDTMTKVLHLTRFAAKPIARLCEVDLDFRKVKRRVPGPDKNETVVVEAAVFGGFAHDVEHAMLLMEAVYRRSESEWAAFVQTEEYSSMERSPQVARRTQHLRQRAHDAGELFSRLAQEETFARMQDPEARAISRLKRKRLDAI